MFAYVATAGFVFAPFAGYAFLTTAVYRATAVVGIPPAAVLPRELPPPRELSRRFHDAVVDGELLEQIAKEGGSVSDVLTADRLRSTVDITGLDARTFVVSFTDSAPERAQHLCNWVARRIVQTSASVLGSMPPSDASNGKPVQRLAEQLTTLLESAPPESSAQPRVDVPPAADVVVSVLQAERVRLSLRVDRIAIPGNPYDEPEVDVLKHKIAEIDHAIATRRQSLQRTGTASPVPPDVEKRLRDLLQAASDGSDTEARRDMVGAANGARVIVEAALPTWPVEPNRRWVLLIGLMTSLGTTLAVALARRAGTRKQPDEPARPPAVQMPPPEAPLPSRESIPPPMFSAAQEPGPAPVEPAPSPLWFGATHVVPTDPEPVHQFGAPRGVHAPSITLITQPFGSPSVPPVAPRERAEVYAVLSPTGPETPVQRPVATRTVDSANPPQDAPFRRSAAQVGSLRPTSRTATTQTFGMPAVPRITTASPARERPTSEKLPLPRESRRGAPGRRSDRPGAPPPTVDQDDPPESPTRSSAPPRVTARIAPLDLSTCFRPDRSLLPAARTALRDSLLPYSREAGFVVGILSGPASRQEKSRVAAELTLALTESGERRVLLIEGDGEHPSVQRLMGVEIPMAAGFSLQLETHVPGLAEPESWTVVHCSKWLDLLAEGGIRSDETLLSRKFRSCVLAIKDHYDVVVIDGPLLTQESECRVLDGVADGIVIVAGRGESSIRERAENLLSPKCFTAVVAS